MLNYFYIDTKKKGEEPKLNNIKTADIIKKTEEITNRWVSTGIKPEKKDKEQEDK